MKLLYPTTAKGKEIDKERIKLKGDIEGHLEFMKYDLDDMAKELSKIKECI